MKEIYTVVGKLLSQNQNSLKKKARNDGKLQTRREFFLSVFLSTFLENHKTAEKFTVDEGAE